MRRELVHALAQWLAALALALALIAAARVASAQSPSDTVGRGEYLAHAADCLPCHTAPEGKPYAGGRAFKLPFGTLYAPNITPDNATGIGAWSDDDFVRAMHDGIGKNGQHLYPAFPYSSYTLMTRDDVLAIKSYLFSLTPVSSRAPGSELRFPFNQRWLMTFWNWLYKPNHRFEPDPARPADWNRGAYLVEALGHCGDCHTPRNILQGPKSGAKFAGAVIEGWRAYNITPDRETGIGGWTYRELVDYLAAGISRGHGAAAGPMSEVAEHSLRFLTLPDVEAMASYLRSVPPVAARDIPPIARPQVAEGGSRLPDRSELERRHEDPGLHMFAGACTGCHGWEGNGLVGTRAVNDPTALNLTQVVLGGLHLRSRSTEVDMPQFGWTYSDPEVAGLANYVTGRFGARAAQLTSDDIRRRRQGE